MKDYIIISDSTADLSAEIIENLNIEILPLKFHVDEKTYLNYPDERELSNVEFYNLLKSGKSMSTSQINVSEFVEVFEKHIKAGQDILYIAFSSGLSGTYNSARIAAKELTCKYKDAKIIVIDSLCACMGEGLLLYYAANKKISGCSIEDVAVWVEDHKLNVCHWFTVNDLFHLKRGGRVSSVAAIMGTALGVKPVLHVDNEGHLIPVYKVRGRKQSLDKLVDKMQETSEGIDNPVVFISHANCREDAEYVAKQIKKKMKIKDIKIGNIGPVIGAHAGPGTVALFFLGHNR